MADIIVSRLGQVLQAGDATALFQKIFAGEILTAFNQTNKLLGMTRVRTISNGKSASFPLIGRVNAGYHTPGTLLGGQKVNHDEIVITLDDKLVSDVFIADIDEAMNYFDVRAPYSNEMGTKLGNVMDFNIAVEIIKAARAGSRLKGEMPGGTEIKDDKMKIGAGGATNKTEQALAIAGNIFAAAEALDEKHAPTERYCALRPADYNALVQNKEAINKDWGGEGAYSDGTIFKVGGVNIVKMVQIPKTDTTKDTDPNYNKFHSVDASKTIGMVWTPDAVGTVKLMDLSMQSEYLIQLQGTLMVARYAVGHGTLRPECAVELKLNTLSN